MNAFRTRTALFSLVALLTLGLTQTGCNASRTAQGAGVGAGAGAIIGGVIGRATGSTARGAIIGAAVGGTAGAVIGRQMDRQAEELERELEAAEVERVTDPATGAEGIAVTFNNELLFDRGQATLRPGVRADLSDLAQSLQTYAGHDAVIVGHASSDGSTQLNQDLSERRADAVAGYLSQQGVAYSRLRTSGAGEMQPVASNDTEAGRELNRRVEIAIYASEQYRSEVESQTGG